ncbi:1,4-alpha-glucan branching enzyme [Allonocardiopsis opalescens]|uniref:1,4-alpha-glucan branching enzyme GlgB n=2 Tax=Allonocardiopsis opalescens TaxID=1144618 RepID=A0A2T0QDT2_9ACTN|nr:1,4-alpha-glucan branching enzyme [Allonocardiopsis opalescens]
MGRIVADGWPGEPGGEPGPPPSLLGDLDLHLLGEGRHEQLWRVLGAHVRTDSAGAPVGTSFAVWAPNARAVQVIGDFNYWNGDRHAMSHRGGGVWELFVPGIGDGSLYKYRVHGADGEWKDKADPLAFAAEEPPRTASRVYTSRHVWTDGDWLETRAKRDWVREPMSVYEVHLASWRPGLGFRELADQLVDYVTDLGFTHVEFMPVAQHPFGGSWGYQITSYYAVDSRLGTPDDFRALVDRLHQAGIGVIIDWVPAHFPKDEWALARFDGTHLYEHADRRRGEHPDWGTLVFNYGRHEVRNFLVANALYWLEEMHVDALRVDAVASMLYLDYSREDGDWLPNEYGGRENLDAVRFLQEMNATCYRRVPGVFTAAEESTAWPGVTAPTEHGGLGFGFKWNMGWMHDTLEYLTKDPVHRQYHHNEITFSLIYAFSENYVLPLSHDEVVHGKRSLLHKMPGDEWQQTAGLRSLLGYMWAHPGKQLLFMGGEFGQGDEWSQDRGLDWWVLDYPRHQGVQRLVRDLNRVYADTPALWTRDAEPAGYTWIDGGDAAGNTLSFFRTASSGERLVCLVNFAGHPHHDFHVGMPATGRWREVINTDAAVYGGSGVGNPDGIVTAEPSPWHGQPASARVTLPPYGVLWLAQV